MTEDHRYSVSVAGVIVDDEGRALIIQRRDNGHWEPPGGILEHGETIEDGLRREVYEETDLTMAGAHLSGVYQNMKRHIVALVFRCHAFTGSLSTNDEVAAFLWAEERDLHALMTEAYAVRITDALGAQKGTSVRVHNGTRILKRSPTVDHT